MTLMLKVGEAKQINIWIEENKKAMEETTWRKV